MRANGLSSSSCTSQESSIGIFSAFNTARVLSRQVPSHPAALGCVATLAQRGSRRRARAKNPGVSGDRARLPGMTSEWSQDELDRQAAKLAPERIRHVLAFAGLFQMMHEMIKSSVLDAVAGFYGHVRSVDRWMWGKERYNAQVLSKAPKKPFDASLAWLVEAKAITQEQSDRLAAVYAHRHDLTHSLAKYVVYLDYEPDYRLFLDALNTLGDLSRFWTQVEVDTGTFEDYPGVKAEEIVPLNIAVLDLCIQALYETFPQDGSGDPSS